MLETFQGLHASNYKLLNKNLNKTTLTMLQVRAWLWKRSSRAFDNQFSGSTPDVSFRLSFLASALFVLIIDRKPS